MTSGNEGAEVKQQRFLENLFEDMRELIPFLDDPAVSDIAVQDSGEIIVTKFGEGRLFTGIRLTSMDVKRITLATAALMERKLDNLGGFPILEGVLPKYDARITCMMPPNLSRYELSIRKPAKTIYSLEDYVAHEQMNQEQYELLVRYVSDRKNIIVSGGTGSGKTTLTKAIIKKMVELTPDDNFYIVEDLPELVCEARMKAMIWIQKEHAVRAVEEALRWNPDRIIFGEVRNGYVMNALLEAWNTGHTGNVTTLHADNCLSTVQRIRGLLRQVYGAGELPKLSETIHLIVHLSKTTKGIRVDEIMPVKEDTDSLLTLIEQNNLG